MLSCAGTTRDTKSGKNGKRKKEREKSKSIQIDSATFCVLASRVAKVETNVLFAFVFLGCQLINF